MSWVFLAIAVAGDVAGTAALERSTRGRYRRRYFALATAGYLLAVGAFARALQTIPTSVADAIYFAGATALIAAFGLIWHRESLTFRKAAALLLVVVGVVVLRLEPAHG